MSIVFYIQINSIGLPTLSVSIVSYTLRRHAGLQIDSIGLPALNVSIVFYMLQDTDGLHCIAHIERFYVVLHALEATY